MLDSTKNRIITNLEYYVNKPIYAEMNHEWENMLAQKEITISIKSLDDILTQLSECHHSSANTHAVAIRFFQKKGLNINKLYSNSDLNSSDKADQTLSDEDRDTTFTPLMLCSTYGPIVEALLDCGANISIKNNQGLTALNFFVPDFMALKNENCFRSSDFFLAFNALSLLLETSTPENRTAFFKQYLPVANLPDLNKTAFIEFYTNNTTSYNYSDNNIESDDEAFQPMLINDFTPTKFKSYDFATSFVYMLPRIPSLDAQKMLRFYIRSLHTTEERTIFKTKMQGLLEFVNSTDAEAAQIEESSLGDTHQKRHWIQTTHMINDL